MYALAPLSTATATPTTFGATVATHELRCALDTDPANSTYLWTGSDQPVVWHYSLISTYAPLSLFTGYELGIYCRIANGAYTEPNNPGNYNDAYFQTSANGSVWSGHNLTGRYGDISAGAADEGVLDTPPANQQDGQFVISIAATTNDYHKLILGTQGADDGANYSVMQLMSGILLELPMLSTERDWQDEFHGGNIEYTQTGHANWSGLRAYGGRASTQKIFSELTTAQKDLLMALFFYGRGNYPVLFMEDDTDVRTWIYGRISRMTEREPRGALHTVEWQLEQY